MGIQHDIRVEELPPVYQMIVKIIGLENTLRLGKEIGGEQIYFPRLDYRSSSFIKARNRRILDDYGKGRAVKMLAAEHRLTQRQIYHIIGKGNPR